MKRNFKKQPEFERIESSETDEKELVDEPAKICNSCKFELPAILDRGICPQCGRIN